MCVPHHLALPTERMLALIDGELSSDGKPSPKRSKRKTKTKAATRSAKVPPAPRASLHAALRTALKLSRWIVQAD